MTCRGDQWCACAECQPRLPRRDVWMVIWTAFTAWWPWRRTVAPSDDVAND